MGYDIEECLICYTQNRGNETTENEITLCFSCMEKYTGDNISGRVLNIFTQYIVDTNVICKMCAVKKKWCCTIKCCEDCEEKYFQKSQSP